MLQEQFSVKKNDNLGAKINVSYSKLNRVWRQIRD